MIKNLKKVKCIMISDFYDLISSQMVEMKANFKFFKERLENLMSREYIKRDKNNQLLIWYLP